MTGTAPLVTAEGVVSMIEQELALTGDLSDETWAQFIRYVDALPLKDVLSVLTLLSSQ